MKTICITDPKEIEGIIRKCPYCTVGLTDLNGNPYVIPMNFAYDASKGEHGTIFLHSGPEGSKLDMVQQHPTVCISFCEGHELVYMHQQIACSYSMKSRSVMCRGQVRFIDDMDENRRLPALFMEHNTKNKCGFSDPAVRNVKIGEIPVEEICCKSFGLRPGEVQYRELLLVHIRPMISPATDVSLYVCGGVFVWLL